MKRQNIYEAARPNKCPACHCTETKVDVWDFIRFRCGAAYNVETGRWWKSCRRAFDVAVQLRARVSNLELDLLGELVP